MLVVSVVVFMGITYLLARRFMAASKVLGEETVSGTNGVASQTAGTKPGEK